MREQLIYKAIVAQIDKFIKLQFILQLEIFKFQMSSSTIPQQKPQQHIIKNITLPFAIIALINLASFSNRIPIFIQLLLNSTCCVYIGCVLGSKLSKKPSGQFCKVQKEQHEEEESIDMRQAMKFPIVASVFLFGFYLLYKYVNKDIVNFLITLQFCLATVISTSSMLLTYVKFSQPMQKVIKHVNPWDFLKKYLDFTQFDISYASIITTLTCSVPVILFYITKHWFLNNVFGILFSITALKSINLSSFKVGFILLWALFFYDIFWVYGTDVMVTVAKNLDIPIKLVFPYYATTVGQDGVQVTEQKFSMLGLGDIVVPGIFVALCIKFDVDKALQKLKIKEIQEVKTPYFNTCMIGYFLGIVETFAVMYIFNHPQPALLFLVPMCTLPVVGLSYFRKELKEIEEYSTDHPDNPKKEKREEDKGFLDKLFDRIQELFTKKEDKKE